MSGSARPFAALRDLHLGETVYLVGKGPSLARLSARHFGVGPVIVVNSAIVAVDALELPNLVYSVQKDGCNYTGDCATCDGATPPHCHIDPGDHYIGQRPRAEHCCPEAAVRYVYDLDDLGLDRDGMPSVLVALRLARHMGAGRVVLCCFDALAGGVASRSYDPTGWDYVHADYDRTADYEWTSAWARTELATMSASYLTPEEE